MPITRLVCSGCGAKGVAYVGIYQALIQQGVMDNITDVAGTSAGSIAATLFAIGTSEDELKALLADSDFKTLLGDRVPGALFTKDGNPILSLLRNQINKSIKTFLDNPERTKRILEDTTLTLIEDIEREKKIDVLKTKLNSPDASVSFEDLGLLQRCFPQKFKNLTVTAVKLPNGEIQVFNQHATPNIEIATACRASASIPIALQPVSMFLPGIDEKQALVDGGVYDITPADYFDGDQDKGTYTNHKENETLLLTFDENNKNENFYDDFITDVLLESIIGNALQKGIDNVRHNINEALNELKKVEVKYSEKFEAVIKALESLTEEQISEISKGNLSQGVNIIKNQLSKVYTPTFYERMTRDKIMSWLSGLKLDYVFTDRKAANYEKIQTRYNNRSVCVNLGSMSSGDFGKAQSMKREIVAMGYLDTLSYLSDNLHISQHMSQNIANASEKKVEDPKTIYENLITEFTKIYLNVLEIQGKDPQKDTLLRQIQEMKNNGIKNQDIVHKLIKPLVEKNMLSVTGFAFSRAIELNNGKIDSKDLEKEIGLCAKKYNTLFNRLTVVLTQAGNTMNKYTQNILNITQKKEPDSLQDKPKNTDGNSFKFK